MAQNWAFVDIAGGGLTTYPVVMPISTPVSIGQTILVMFGHSYPPCSPNVTDNLGNVYTRVVNGVQNVSTQFQYAYYAPVTVAGSCTVTITASCGVTRVGSYAAVYDNLALSPYDDQHSTDGSNTTGNVTTTEADDLLCSFFLGPPPFSSLSGDQRYISGGETFIDQNVPSVGTAAGSATPSGTMSNAFAFAWKQIPAASANTSTMFFRF